MFWVIIYLFYFIFVFLVVTMRRRNRGEGRRERAYLKLGKPRHIPPKFVCVFFPSSKRKSGKGQSREVR